MNHIAYMAMGWNDYRSGLYQAAWEGGDNGEWNPKLTYPYNCAVYAAVEHCTTSHIGNVFYLNGIRWALDHWVVNVTKENINRLQGLTPEKFPLERAEEVLIGNQGVSPAGQPVVCVTCSEEITECFWVDGLLVYEEVFCDEDCARRKLHNVIVQDADIFSLYGPNRTKRPDVSLHESTVREYLESLPYMWYTSNGTRPRELSFKPKRKELSK